MIKTTKFSIICMCVCFVLLIVSCQNEKTSAQVAQAVSDTISSRKKSKPVDLARTTIYLNGELITEQEAKPLFVKDSLVVNGGTGKYGLMVYGEKFRNGVMFLTLKEQ